VSSLRRIAEIEAEVTYYHDRVALLRARLYRNGLGTTPRLEELERQLDSARRRLRAARATAPPPPEPVSGPD
jgi:hypothetical protein